MLRLSLLFFVLAVAAGVMGFTGWAGTFTSLTVIAFYVFGAFLIFSLLAGLVGAGIYAWVDHGMSAKNLGAALDRNAAQVTADASGAISDAAQGTEKFVGDVGDSAKNAVDKAAPNGKK